MTSQDLTKELEDWVNLQQRAETLPHITQETRIALTKQVRLVQDGLLAVQLREKKLERVRP